MAHGRLGTACLNRFHRLSHSNGARECSGVYVEDADDVAARQSRFNAVCEEAFVVVLVPVLLPKLKEVNRMDGRMDEWMDGWMDG